MTELDTPNPHKRRRKRPPAPLCEHTFERAAVSHLNRYPSSTVNLRRVLERRAWRICDETGEDPAAAAPFIAAAVAKMAEWGLLDDRAYGAALVRRMRARGSSRHRIAAKLSDKGIASGLTHELLPRSDDSDDVDAAWTYARRRRFGPYRGNPAQRAERRDRDLAAMGRAGFGYGIARQVIEAECVPGPG